MYISVAAITRKFAGDFEVEQRMVSMYSMNCSPCGEIHS